MSGAHTEQSLILSPESTRLEDVSASAVTLEHGVIDHVAQVCSIVSDWFVKVLKSKLTIGLPVESNKLGPSTPVLLRQKIRRGNTRAFWVYPHKMCSIVLDEIKHAVAFKHL